MTMPLGSSHWVFTPKRRLLGSKGPINLMLHTCMESLSKVNIFLRRFLWHPPSIHEVCTPNSSFLRLKRLRSKTNSLLKGSKHTPTNEAVAPIILR
ncbi:hypothetical protein FKM82_028060 [Ascaphus truei]